MLRNNKPQTGERREAIFMPEVQPTAGEPSAGIPPTAAVVEASQDVANPSENKPTDETNEGDAMAVASPDAKMRSDDCDDDSHEAVGKEEAAELDQDMMDSEPDSSINEVVVEVDPSEPAKVTTMFQKILALGSASGQVVVKLENPDQSSEQIGATASQGATPVTGPSASQPTLVHNGRMVSLDT
jgi:hypothetical protein